MTAKNKIVQNEDQDVKSLDPKDSVQGSGPHTWGGGAGKSSEVRNKR